MECYCQVLVLVVSITAATSKSFAGEEISRADAQKIKEIVRELQRRDAKNSHHHVSHNHDDPRLPADDHDLTNIQTLNRVSKDNNGRAKPNAKISAEDNPQATSLNDLICQLGGKCNGDFLNDDIVVLERNLHDVNANYDRNPLDSKDLVNSINYKFGKKNPTVGDVNVENLLENLEKTLAIKNDDNWGTSEANDYIKMSCNGNGCQLVSLNNNDDSISNGVGDDDVVNFLNDLETALGKSDGLVQRCGCSRADDMDEATSLRCGCSKNKKASLKKSTLSKKINLSKKKRRTREREDNVEDYNALVIPNNNVDSISNNVGGNNVVNFLNDLVTSLRKSDGLAQRCGCSRADDMDEATLLRCGCSKNKRKSRTGEREDSIEDNNVFLRCYRKCANLQYYRTNDPNIRDDEKVDDKAYLRCCKQCGRSEHFRNVIMGVTDSQDHDKSNEYHYNDGKSKNVDISERAKVYPINEDLDAIVIDVFDLDNILKLTNNDNNYDNADTIRDYVRGGNEKLMAPKRLSAPVNKASSLLPLTQMQKQKFKQLQIRNELRRNVMPDVEKYGLPFQLDIQGLGQVNP